MFGLMLWFVALGCGGCSSDKDGSGSDPGEDAQLLFIGLDGLDPLLLRGLLREEPEKYPNMHKLVDEGFLVDLDVSSYPMLSPILWTSIGTGYEQDQHGVTGWTRENNEAVSQQTVRARRFWEAADQDGQTVLQLGSLLTSPVVELNGVNVGDALVRSWYNKSSSNADLDNHVYPASRSDELGKLIPNTDWLGAHPILGHQIQTVGGGVHPLAADEANVRFFEMLWPELQPQLGVLYLKGADRVGHLADPLSQTGQATAASTRYAKFSDIGPQWVGEYYLYIDEALGRIMEHVDPRTTTVVLASDHGFEINNDESEYLSRHRNPGLLIGWGHSARTDVGYTTVSQLDLGVTLYGLLGLPPGADSKGRYLHELFDLEDAPSPLGSWILEEALPLANEGSGVSTSADQIEQLKALGYVEESGEERVDRQYR